MAIAGERMETVRHFILGGLKITADGDCSHEIKRHLLPGRKVMTNLDSILKSRDITLLTNVCLVKAMDFPVAMHGCESWTIKKAECQKIDAFELWCWGPGKPNLPLGLRGRGKAGGGARVTAGPKRPHLCSQVPVNKWKKRTKLSTHILNTISLSF